MHVTRRRKERKSMNQVSTSTKNRSAELLLCLETLAQKAYGTTVPLI